MHNIFNNFYNTSCTSARIYSHPDWTNAGSLLILNPFSLDTRVIAGGKFGLHAKLFSANRRIYAKLLEQEMNNRLLWTWHTKVFLSFRVPGILQDLLLILLLIITFVRFINQVYAIISYKSIWSFLIVTEKELGNYFSFLKISIKREREIVE